MTNVSAGQKRWNNPEQVRKTVKSKGAFDVPTYGKHTVVTCARAQELTNVSAGRKRWNNPRE